MKNSSATMIWLLGQPHLHDYIRFVRSRTVGAGEQGERDLIDEWRAANDVYYELEQQGEPGIAENVCHPPPDSLAARVAAIRSSARYAQAFGGLPSEIVRVELGRLIVSQAHVDPAPAQQRLAASGPLDEQALLEFCLPGGDEMPPVEVTRLSSTRYRLSSPSTDLRAHAVQLLAGGALAGIGAEGPVHSLVTVPIGFGSNFMSAIRSAGRVVLQNGHNRAYALAAAGYPHAYCVVEDVTRKDELGVASTSDSQADPEFHFAARRPPLLRDFLDPRFAKRLHAKPIRCEIEVEIRISETNATLETKR